MRIIAICNQKGGAGKTSTAWAITTGSAIRGKLAAILGHYVKCEYIKGFTDEGDGIRIEV
jgi:hypothetical protein